MMLNAIDVFMQYNVSDLLQAIVAGPGFEVSSMTWLEQFLGFFALP